MATHEEIQLSENAKKLVDLIVKIIVNATFRELELEDHQEAIQKHQKVRKSKRDSNNNR